MHTCPPPSDAVKKWLKGYSSTVSNYGHLLLEQVNGKDGTLIAALRPYFESAHLDARERFHACIGMDLHPDADGPGINAIYPSCLPTKAIRGLFGEAMAGLITETYPFIGKYKWTIPVFLFRYDDDAAKYLFDLARNPERTRSVFGRRGTDFIALCLKPDGSIERFIAGEAKYRSSLTDSVVNRLLLGELVDGASHQGTKVHSGKGIWFQLNNDTPNPLGLRQLQWLLIELAPDEYAEAILALDKALCLKDPQPLPRTDFILLAGHGAARREAGEPLIPWEQTPDEYTAGNDLQIVELILTDGNDLIDELYGCLWATEATSG